MATEAGEVTAEVVSGLRGQVEALENEKRELKKTVNKMKAERTRTEAELQTALSRIDSLEKGGGTSGSEVSEELKRLLSMKEDLLVVAVKEKGEAEERYKVLEKANIELDGKYKQLEKRISEKDGEIATLKKKGEGGAGDADVKALKSLNENLEKEIAKSSSVISDLKSKLEAAKGEESVRREEIKIIKNDMKSLESRHRELQVAYDKLEEEDNSTKEKFAATRKKCNDAVMQYAEAQTALDQLKKSHDELKDNFLELQTKYDHQNKLYITMDDDLKETRARERDLSSTVSEYTGKIDLLSKENEDLKAANSVLSFNLKEETKAKETLKEEVSKLHTSLDEARKALQDQVLEHKIASRKSVQMIKDLKAQLAKSAQESEKRVAAVPSISPAGSQEDLAPTRSATPPTLARTDSGSIPADPSRDGADDMKRMLAKRLEMLLTENAVVREKVRFLESTVQSLTVELEQKKVMVKQLMGDSLGDTTSLQTLSRDEIFSLINRLMTDNKILANEVSNLNKRFEISKSNSVIR